ncbi:MAG: hypothetical protein WBZ37_29015 [Mycobacterium sp.]
MGSEHHVTTVKFTGAGCQAYCLARGCRWTGTYHLGDGGSALAYYQAQQDGRRHVVDE